MKTYAILRRSGWRDEASFRQAGERSRRVGDREMPDQVRWIRSYALSEEDGRLGTICIYEAVDADALREHARRAGIPADEIVEVSSTVIVRPDPVAA